MGIREARRLQEMVMVMGNRTIVCQDRSKVWSRSIWHANPSPLHATLPLLLFQLSLISTVSKLIDLCLRPLGQSTVVSQILGGMLFGPSMLGHHKGVADMLFPARGAMMIETLASFGIVFFIFTVGLKMEPTMLINPQPQAVAIGISVFCFTLVLPMILAIILKAAIPMNTSLSDSIMIIAGAQCFTSCPVVACLLTELKLINTEIGRLALTASNFCDVFGILLSAIVYSISLSRAGNFATSMLAIMSLIGLVCSIVFVVRPVILRFINAAPIGKPMAEAAVINLFVLVLGTAFASELIGQHFVFGPLVLGIAMPDGPPLGTTLGLKLDTFVSGLLYPTYLAVSGLQTNIYKIQFQSFWVVAVVIAFSFVVKTAAAMLPAMFCKHPTNEALVIGLIMNARGIVDVLVVNIMKQSKFLGDEEFSLAILSFVAITVFITPLIKLLYDPWNQYRKIKRSTIQHTKQDSEFRIMVCIHHNDSVPTIINLLEVSYASLESHLVAFAMVLVEMAGRTTPLLVSHRAQQPKYESSNSTTGQIVNALRRYEQHNQGCAMVESFTSISPYPTMHEDICRLAFDKRANIIIVPFHKLWAIDGSVGSVNKSIRTLNLSVLEKAPCSVGILLDRGMIAGSLSVIVTKRVYNVGVLFFEGPDDTEALAYAARMSKHESVNLVVTRYLLFGSENSKDRKRDSEIVNVYREANSGNERFTYKEEVVRDGVGIAASIKGMVDSFDLILVGKHHQESPLFMGLEEWSECREMGIVGDMLASPDFGTKASVIVIQQQRIRGPLCGGGGGGNRNPRKDHSDFGGGGAQVHDISSFEETSTKHSVYQRPTHHSDETWSIAIKDKEKY